MKTLNPGKFEITLGGETKTVLISLGLKTELYKLITKAQLELAGLNERVFMDEGLAEKIQAKDAEIKALEAAEAEIVKIEIAQAELDVLYGEALAEMEARQNATLQESALQRIDMTEGVFAKAISCLLSERDDFGKITNELSTEVIMWSPVYAEAQEELTELLHAVTEYITSALKKISGINQLVTEITEEASPKESPAE